MTTVASRKAKGRKGMKNPNWKGGKVKKFCEKCSKPFFVKQSLVAQLFCSTGCAQNSQRLVVMRENKRRQHKVVDGVEVKCCGICRCWKLLSEFYAKKTAWDGLNCKCKQCSKDYNATRRDDSEFVKEKREYSRLWYKQNRDYACRKSKEYYLKNREKCLNQSSVYAHKHPDKMAKYYKNYHMRARKYDPKYRLSSSIMRSFSRCFTGVTQSYTSNHEQWLGYSIDTLMAHIQSLFQLGMTWDNYGKWHLDHKVPVSVFNFTKPTHIDFKRCWALENLQPLWARDNIVKKDKLYQPFQPNLEVSI